jgi:HEAT repeat protein
MSFRRNGSILKTISCIVIITFLTLNVSWAASVDRGGAFNSDLSAQSPFQGRMMTEQAELFRQSILADIDLMTVVFSIAKCLLGDPESDIKPLPIKYLETTVTEEFGKPIENVVLSNVTIENDIIRVPYEKEEKKYVVQIALNDKAHPEKLAGYEWIISDKYLVKVLPEGYTEAEQQPTKVLREQKVVVTEPLPEMWDDTQVAQEETGLQKKSFSIRAILRGKILGIEPFSMGAVMGSAILGMNAIGNWAKSFISAHPVITAIIALTVAIILYKQAKRIFGPIFFPLGWHIKMLQHGNKKQKDRASKALVGMGEPASLRLIALLQDENVRGNIHQRALNILENIEEASIPGLIEFVKDAGNKHQLRRKAMNILLKMKDPRILEFFTEKLLNEDISRADDIVKYIISMGSASAAPVLEKLYDSERVSMRIKAISGLRQLKSPKSVPMMIGALEDISEEVRIAAIRALGNMGDPVALKPLFEVANDEDIHGKRKEIICSLHSIDALKAIKDKRAINAIVNIFGRTFSAEIIEFIGKCSDPAVAAYISKTLAENEHPVEEWTKEQMSVLANCLRDGSKFALVLHPAKTHTERGLLAHHEDHDYDSSKKGWGQRVVVDFPARLEIKMIKTKDKDILEKPRAGSRRASFDASVPVDGAEIQIHSEDLIGANNIRTNFVDAINDLYVALSEDAERPPLVRGVFPKKREETSIRIAIGAKILLKEVNAYPTLLTPQIREKADLVRKLLPQFEVHTFIEGIILKARQAQRNGQSLIIGLDTSWIPELEKEGSLQHNALSSLMKEIYSLGDTLKGIGLDNVVIVHESSARLAGEILSECEEHSTDLSNVVVLAASGTIEAAAFTPLKSTSTEKKAFLAGVDATALNEFIAGKGAGLEELNINILEMLTLTLELASGKDAPKVSLIQSYDKAKRIVILFPKAEALDYQKLREEYKMRREFLQAA